MSVEARLRELGIVLPEAAAPVASYQPVVVHAGFAHVSGQLPFIDGVLKKGRLGENVNLPEGIEAARACGLMILAQLREAGVLEKDVRHSATMATESIAASKSTIDESLQQSVNRVTEFASTKPAAAAGIAFAAGVLATTLLRR